MVTIPKRNKSKDNPYTLGFDENKKIYTVEFLDNKKIKQKVEVSEVVYKAFDKFELEDISQIHKYRSHIEHSEIYEETIEHRIFHKKVRMDEEIEKNILIDEMKKAIDTLSPVQKRRIKLYYFENKTLKEIALLEHCSINAVKLSIDAGIVKLQKILQK